MRSYYPEELVDRLNRREQYDRVTQPPYQDPYDAWVDRQLIEEMDLQRSKETPTSDLQQTSRLSRSPLLK